MRSFFREESTRAWEKNMLISIRKAPSRAQRVEVEVVQADWQQYLLS